MGFAVLHWEAQGNKSLLDKVLQQEMLMLHDRKSQLDSHQRVCQGQSHCKMSPVDRVYNQLNWKSWYLDYMLRMDKDTVLHTLYLKGKNDLLDNENHEDLRYHHHSRNLASMANTFPYRYC